MPRRRRGDWRIAIRLVNDKTGAVAASTVTASIGDSWQKYEFTFKTGACPSADNHLEFLVQHPGTAWFPLVSLFPPTYHNRAQWQSHRSDGEAGRAASGLSALSRRQLSRGRPLNEHYEWKKTIGPLVDRPTHPTPWTYRSSDGMGLLEFLNWCEDLHMEPLLAVFAGYSLQQEHVDAGAGSGAVRSGALDEIEYVTGDASTRWGAERAKDGHPAPFHLQFVEIGNEEYHDPSGLTTRGSRSSTRPSRSASRIATGGHGAGHLYVPTFWMTTTTRCTPTSIGRRSSFLRMCTTTTITIAAAPKFWSASGRRVKAANDQLGRGTGRCRVDDGPGAQQRYCPHGLLRAAVRQRESRRHGVAKRSDRVRRDEQLRIAKLLCASHVQHALGDQILHPVSTAQIHGCLRRRLYNSKTHHLFIKLVNASSAHSRSKSNWRSRARGTQGNGDYPERQNHSGNKLDHGAHEDCPGDQQHGRRGGNIQRVLQRYSIQVFDISMAP